MQPQWLAAESERLRARVVGCLPMRSQALAVHERMHVVEDEGYNVYNGLPFSPVCGDLKQICKHGMKPAQCKQCKGNPSLHGSSRYPETILLTIKHTVLTTLTIQTLPCCDPGSHHSATRIFTAHFTLINRCMGSVHVAAEIIPPSGKCSRRTTDPIAAALL